jgi:hypothetical protein
MMADDMQSTIIQESLERKAYRAPAIVHELKLETRAGSPLRPELVDPLGIDPTQPQVN